MLLSITTDEKTAEAALVIVRDHLGLNAHIVDCIDGQATLDINHEEGTGLSVKQILELVRPFAKLAEEV